MHSTTETIKTLRNILRSAKITFCEKGCDIDNDNDALYEAALSAFSKIGKEDIYELKSEVFEFLDCKDFCLKETAITTLGLSSRLHLPEFKEIAYKIWLEEDENSVVKGAALRAWASYYSETSNPEVLEILYNILIDENYIIEYRRSAMENIFRVSNEKPKFFDPYRSTFYLLPSHDAFNKKVDWHEIAAIMKKYVPNWQEPPHR